MKPLIHAYCSRKGDRYQYAAVSGFFYCPFDIRSPHESKHLHGWRGRKHRAALHPAGNPSELCARYRARQGDMVRQDPYRVNRTLMGKLVRYAHGLGGEASHPWGNYCLNKMKVSEL